MISKVYCQAKKTVLKIAGSKIGHIKEMKTSIQLKRRSKPTVASMAYRFKIQHILECRKARKGSPWTTIGPQEVINLQG